MFLPRVGQGRVAGAREFRKIIGQNKKKREQ